MPSKIGKKKAWKPEVVQHRTCWLALFFLLIYPTFLQAQQVEKLVPSDSAPFDQFGAAVALSGDVLIVGANFHDNPVNNAGAAYMYQREAGQWILSDKITADNGREGDAFGLSVAIDGDFAIVGALGDDEKGSNAGAAYVYRWDGDAWFQQYKLTANDGAENDAFGYAVAIKGDYALIGARGADVKGNSSGAAYLFVRSGNVWVQLNKLAPGEGAGGAFFGTSVALNETFAVVGAELADGVEAGAGAVYVFENRGAIWLQYARLIASDGAQLDQLGASVAIYEGTVVAGSPGNDAAGVDAGAVYLFENQDVGFVEVDKLIISRSSSADFFGHSVSMDGPLMVVGAPGDDDLSSGAGAAYVFERQKGDWRQVSKLLPDVNARDAGLGVSVGADGHQAIIGAWMDKDTGAGAAYVFDLSTVLTHVETAAKPEESASKNRPEVYPNPFVTNTTIAYALETSAHVDVMIFDLTGRVVRILRQDVHPAGVYAEVWDGRDAKGQDAPAGVYFAGVGPYRTPIFKVR